MIDLHDLSDRLAKIRERIGKAAVRSGREEDAITLVAVTKKQPAALVRIAHDARLYEIGENFVQEAFAKQEDTRDLAFRWHMLGHLQTNKVREAVSAFDLIQSVDSVRLARAIGTAALAAGKIQDVLLQAHLGAETSKFGLPPESVQDAAHEIAQISGLRLCGLMGIAPLNEEPRPYFRTLRRLAESLATAGQPIVSMGMSGDFETAIEEGSTMVRIGTGLFGARNG